MATQASIKDWNSVNIGGKDYTKDYANDPRNEEEIRQAVVNGNNQINVADGKGNAWENTSGNQISYAPQAPQIQQPVVKAPNYSFIDSAQRTREALIQARLQEQLGAQAGLERDAEGNLVKNTEQINGDVYDAQETQRATGVQRGVQYSQQQQAVENGVSRAGMKMIVDAREKRDTAILNIRDRIASLKSGASYEIQASQAQADAEKQKLDYDMSVRQEDRNWAVEDREDNQSFQTGMQDKQFIQQGQLLDKTWNREDEVRFEERKYAEEQQGKQWTREDAVAEKAFSRQIEAMGIDQKYKVELQNLDFSQKKEFLKLETGVQKEIMAIKQNYDIDIFNMTSAQQTKIAGMEAGTRMALAQFDAQTQKSLLASKNAHDTDLFNKEMQAKSSENIKTMWSSYIMNDPGFNMYPNASNNFSINNSQVSKLKEFFTVNGVPSTVQDQMLKGKITPKDVVNQSVKSSGKSENTIKSGIEAILKFK